MFKKNLSLSLTFWKSQAQYSCKVSFYVKREISATNHVVCNVLVLIALAALDFNPSRKGNRHITLSFLIRDP